ncbi:MAG: (2Fe-2S)-binding protein [Rhodothermales bacterium]|nr:(2Fe-2S)-binding protein [Rhodothermales bacterium]
MNIDRCYCFERTFEELKQVADETGASTVKELQDHIVFGHNCRLCHPYVVEMLKSGVTSFNHIIEEEIPNCGEL